MKNFTVNACVQEPVDSLINSLRQEIYSVLNSLHLSKARVALVDFPAHVNVGDNAIWLGEKIALKQLNSKIVYQCCRQTYSYKVLNKKIEDGVILFHGGGNLGDFWPAHHEFRLKIIEDFPNNRIIQLPQSICFSSPEYLKKTQQQFNRHHYLTLLLRDKKSFDFAMKNFKTKNILCPDLGFLLNPCLKEISSKNRIGFLLRTDKESVLSTTLDNVVDIARFDWLRNDTILSKCHSSLRNLLIEYPNKLKFLLTIYVKLFDSVANQRLMYGCNLLRSNEVLVTDRLHGHILSLLLKIPHVFLDSKDGKISAFYDTWTRDGNIGQFATSLEVGLKEATFLSRQFQAERDKNK